jgi:two-component system, OmpR family, sensor kinase
MSLRARLTLLYSSIVGGILLLFGTAVYVAVSASLTGQLDARLVYAANNVLISMRAGDLENIQMPELDLFADVFVQVWSSSGKLEATSQNLQNYAKPLDEVGLRSALPTYRDVPIGQRQLRVLTVPLVVKGTDRVLGALQTGARLDLIQSTQRVLSWVLIVGAAISMLIAGLAGWISTYQALKPLEAVKETALQITRADDLSRRIPYRGPAEDEVGQLIHAFNQTLSRLEKVFNTQRRFLADVGHELRTPLTVIRGNIDLIRRMQRADQESIEGIESEVDRLTRLVGDLLLLAQAESGKLPLVKAEVELDSVILEVLSQMRVLARDRVKLTLGDFDQVLVCGDQDRLKQVFMNLIGNAIKYTTRGGEVVIGVGKEGARARITVTDNGPGIPKEDLPHIFERFYRGEKSRTRTQDGKGFGLGLSIAYWIVRNHDGQIDVSSEENRGTTFCVWLPLATDGCKNSEQAIT